jgi:tetrahydromethanopterin S-methyltransferase subunit A
VLIGLPTVSDVEDVCVHDSHIDRLEAGVVMVGCATLQRLGIEKLVDQHRPVRVGAVGRAQAEGHVRTLTAVG